MANEISTPILASMDLSYLNTLLDEITTTDKVLAVLRELERELTSQAVTQPPASDAANECVALTKRVGRIKRQLLEAGKHPNLADDLAEGHYLEHTLPLIQKVRSACKNSRRKRSRIPPPSVNCNVAHKIPHSNLVFRMPPEVASHPVRFSPPKPIGFRPAPRTNYSFSEFAAGYRNNPHQTSMMFATVMPPLNGIGYNPGSSSPRNVTRARGQGFWSKLDANSNVGSGEHF